MNFFPSRESTKAEIDLMLMKGEADRQVLEEELKELMDEREKYESKHITSELGLRRQR